MQISKDTINIFKALAAVNSNLLIKSGSELTTISPQKNVYASVTVADDFPIDFGIYDLSEWLGVMSLFTDPDVEFSAKYATISEGKSAIKYYAADSSILVVPQKAIKFPSADIEFVLSAATLAMVMNTAGVLRSSDVSITGNGKEISVVVADLKNNAANSFNMAVGTTDKIFSANIKVDNLKLIPGEYEVSLSSKKISHFKHSTVKASFFVALESTSTFE